MKAEDERSIALKAVEEGILSTRQFEEAVANSGDTPLREVLLSKGWIRPSEFDRLAAAEKTERLTPSAPKVPTAAREAMSIADRNLDEYILVSMIGRGGMGEVWKAWDQRLDRWVAIKLSMPMPESDTTLERFHREAVAAARLSHSNIVPIYRVAQQQGRPYIVMKWIEGSTLYKQKFPLRRAMEVIHDVARAVHYAHQQGVIHRDLKPGNIMIDSTQNVWVLDFGLAHLQENQRVLTTAGTTVGTPAYMSPEQAKGAPGAKEPTTDVYSIGATLYEVLTGRPPFQGENVADLVLKVCEEEPTPVRMLRSEIDEEVETIVQKAMDKDPQRRYRSAFELAEDIRRYLNDEPILARPISWSELVVRRLRKNPLVTGLGAAVAAALLALVVIYGVSRGTAREREAALAMIRETARGSTEMALEFRRQGNAKVMGPSVKILETAYEQAVKVLPEQPEVEYLMGRMYRALMDYDRALEYQNKALRKDERFAPALYERVVLRARHYGSDYEIAYRTLKNDAPWSSAPLASDGVEQIYSHLVRLREELLADSERLQALYSRLGEAEVLFAKGVLALYTRRWSDAEQTLHAAVQKDPLKEEAWEALANTYSTRAEAAADRTERERHWNQALRCYKSAIEHDRGYLPHYVGLSKLHFMMGSHRLEQGGDPTEHWREAIRAIDSILNEDAARASLLLIRAGLVGSIGNYKRDSGQDPTTDYSEAEHDVTRALEIGSGRDEVLFGRAEIRRHRGAFMSRRGQDPLPNWQGAEEDLNQIKSKTWQAHTLLGRIHADRGNHRKELGLDPTEDYASAEKQFEVSLRMNADCPMTLRHRAVMNIERGQHLFSLGRDPKEAWSKAEKDIALGLSRDPKDATAYIRMAVLKVHGGIAALRETQQAEPYWKEADELFERGLRESPFTSNGWFRRGQLWMNWGLHRAGLGQDPTAAWEKAEQYFGESLKIDPEGDETLSARGTLRVNRGAVRMNQGADPEPDWREAESDLKKSAQINPLWWEAWASLGLLYQSRGLYRSHRGSDPLPVWKQANEFLDKAIQLNDFSAEARVLRGHLRHLRASEFSSGRGDPDSEWAKAEEDLAEALKRDSKYVSAYLTRCQMRINRGSFRRGANHDPLKDWEGAEQDIQEILKIVPGHPRALTFRVALLMNRGVHWIHQKKDPIADWSAAEDDLTELLKADEKNAELYGMRGMIRSNRGLYSAGRGDDPFPAWAEAERDLSRTLEINRNSAKAWGNRATLYWMRAAHLESLKKPAGADFARAAQDYAEAIRLNPALRSVFEERMNEARSKAESEHY